MSVLLLQLKSYRFLFWIFLVSSFLNFCVMYIEFFLVFYAKFHIHRLFVKDRKMANKWKKDTWYKDDNKLMVFELIILAISITEKLYTICIFEQALVACSDLTFGFKRVYYYTVRFTIVIMDSQQMVFVSFFYNIFQIFFDFFGFLRRFFECLVSKGCKRGYYTILSLH